MRQGVSTATLNCFIARSVREGEKRECNSHVNTARH